MFYEMATVSKSVLSWKLKVLQLKLKVSHRSQYLCPVHCTKTIFMFYLSYSLSLSCVLQILFYPQSIADIIINDDIENLDRFDVVPHLITEPQGFAEVRPSSNHQVVVIRW